MREYITFSLCDETGEADLTPGSRKKVEKLIDLGLLSADWFKDIFGISEQLYDRALFGMREQWRAHAVKSHGEERARALGYFDHLGEGEPH